MTYHDHDEGSAFDGYLQEAEAVGALPGEDYWSPLAAMAWIITRRNDVVAAVQRYEELHHARLHPFPAWTTLSDRLERRFGKGFDLAQHDLRKAGGANRLPGTTARYDRHGLVRIVERGEWRGWSRSFETWGLQLIPNLYDFGFPPEEVRAAFSELVAPPSVAPVVVDLTAWADDAVSRGVTVTEARKDAKAQFGDRAPRQDDCRCALREARTRAGLDTKRGRPVGAKSFAKRDG